MRAIGTLEFVQARIDELASDLLDGIRVSPANRLKLYKPITTIECEISLLRKRIGEMLAEIDQDDD